MRTELSPEETTTVQHARTFAELAEVARAAMERAGTSLAIVCGPISTGGAESPEENLRIFEGFIARIVHAGIAVFDQMPFERALGRIKHAVPDGATRLLNEFYLPLFESGLITVFYFIPRWETSLGAYWEHAQAQRLNKCIIYL